MTWLRDQAAIFCFAVQFLTRCPVPNSLTFTDERFAATPRYYPLVGALVGLAGGLIYVAAIHLFSPVLSVLLSVAATIALTGAFHEDGLADMFDGIGGGLTREKALDIMKDSRLGTYGTVVLGFCLAMKVAALSNLSPALVLPVLVAGHCASRLSSVAVIASSRYVRGDGTGKPVAQGSSGGTLLIAVGTTVAVLAWTGLPLAPLLAGPVAGHVMARLIFERKLGGYTGDTLGGVQQISELGVYLSIAAWCSP